jgi:hypothetical protein
MIKLLANEQDELLLQYFWRELPADQMQQVSSWLQHDAAIAQRYQALCADLQKIRDAMPNAALSSLAITRAKLRLRRHIERQQLQQGQAPETSFAAAPAPVAWLRPALAGALLTLLAVFAIVPRVVDPPLVSKGDASPITNLNTAETYGVEANSAMLRAVRVQVAQSQQTLQALPADLAEQRALLADIVLQNRSFAQRAQLQGQADVARLLRAIEPVLASLAQQPTPQERAALLAQWEFETQVLQTKLQARASKPVPTTQGL